MESNTFHNAMSGSTTTELKLTDLPNELLLCIFDECSDLQSLKNLTISHPHFYRLFAPRSQVMATTILRRQVPDEIFPVLRTALHTKDLGNPEIIWMTWKERVQIVNGVPNCYENDLPTALPMAEVVALERLYHKVDGLAGVFMQDEEKWHKILPEDVCAATVKTHFHHVKRFEIQQAICIFEILRRTLGEKKPPRGGLQDYSFYFHWVMGWMREHLFQRRKISLWQEYIANTIENYFQSRLVQLRIAIYRRTGVAPDSKKQGIDFFHKYMCEEF